MEAGHDDIQKHVRIYMTIFAALAVLTVFTVLASYLHLSPPLAVALALLIASVKASLVACYFMHLISERKTIFGVLLLTAVFLLIMLIVPLLAETGMLVSDVS